MISVSKPVLIRISVIVILVSLIDWKLMFSALGRVRAISNHFSKSTVTGSNRPFSTMVGFAMLLPIVSLKCLYSYQDKKDSILNWVAPGDKSGEFKRQQSVFRNFIENKPGAEFPAEKDRYHLYVSYACPWAHRTLIVRNLKGLQDIIPFTSVHWHMGGKGTIRSI